MTKPRCNLVKIWQMDEVVKYIKKKYGKDISFYKVDGLRYSFVIHLMQQYGLAIDSNGFKGDIVVPVYYDENCPYNDWRDSIYQMLIKEGMLEERTHPNYAYLDVYRYEGYFSLPSDQWS